MHIDIAGQLVYRVGRRRCHIGKPFRKNNLMLKYMEGF